MDGVFPENVTVVIRSVGERTAGLCRQMVCQQILDKHVFMTNISPFAKALKETYEIGLAQNVRWTLAMDADVLLLPGSIGKFIEYAETLIDSVFELEGFIVDKFLPSPRKGGIHLYRTALLEEALSFIQDSFLEIRPETYIKKKMAERGRICQVVEQIVGFHDFEQYYSDIYRKSFVQATKHTKEVNRIIYQWEDLASNDDDFRVALRGFSDGLGYSGQVTIDVGADCFRSVGSILDEMGIKEKEDIVAHDSGVFHLVLHDLAFMLRAKQNELFRMDQKINSFEKSPLYKIFQVMNSIRHRIMNRNQRIVH